MNEAVLKLKESSIGVSMHQGSLKTEKNISYDSLAQIFEKKADTISPFLPGEYGLQKYVISGNKEYYLYLEQPKIVTCKYDVGSSGYDDEPDEDDYDDYDEFLEAYAEWEQNLPDECQNHKFTAPITALFISLSRFGNGSYSVNNILMYSLKTPIYSGEEQLFVAPFSNVYDDGRICWGDNAVSVPQLKSIQGLTTLFFGSPFNSDLDNNRFESFNRKYFDGNARWTLHFQMEVDAMLKDESKTPDDVLAFVHTKLRRTGISVNDKFESFVRNY